LHKKPAKEVSWAENLGERVLVYKTALFLVLPAFLVLQVFTSPQGFPGAKIRGREF